MVLSIVFICATYGICILGNIANFDLAKYYVIFWMDVKYMEYVNSGIWNLGCILQPMSLVYLFAALYAFVQEHHSTNLVPKQQSA
jgi:hypothetical protein